MPEIKDRLVTLKNQDGSFRGLLDHRDGRVYDHGGKVLETMSPNEEVDVAMSDFANDLDRARVGSARGKPVHALNRNGSLSDRLITMDLGVTDIHVDAIGPQFMGGYQLLPAVADLASPVITTPKASNKYPIWDAQNAFRRVLPNANAPGGQVAELNPTLSITPYTTVEYALAGFVTTEVIANADAPLDPYRATVKRLMDALILEREIRVATLLQTTANWNSNVLTTVLAANKWNGGSGSDPIGDLQLIIQKSALPVTRIIWSELLDQTFTKNPAVQNKIYTKQNVLALPVGSDPMLQSQLQLPPITVGRMKYFASGTSTSYVWGSHAVLVHEAANVAVDDVATCKTFRWTGNPATPDGQIQSGGWLFRSFFDNRRGARGGTTGVLAHNDIEVLTSNLVGGEIFNCYQ